MGWLSLTIPILEYRASDSNMHTNPDDLVKRQTLTQQALREPEILHRQHAPRGVWAAGPWTKPWLAPRTVPDMWWRSNPYLLGK